MGRGAWCATGHGVKKKKKKRNPQLLLVVFVFFLFFLIIKLQMQKFGGICSRHKFFLSIVTLEHYLCQGSYVTLAD